MINLIKTNTLDDVAIFEKLKENDLINHKHLIIVPDRIQLSYQKNVLNYLNIQGTFDIKVVSFARLAELVFNDDTKHVIDRQSEIMLIRKIIEDNKHNFKYYKNSSSYVGFAKEVYGAISIIRSNNISSDNLEAILEKLPIKIANKSSDVFLIYKEYLKALKNNYVDKVLMQEALIDNFKNSEFINYNIYISDFYSLNGIELAIIDEMARNSASLTIGIVDTKENGNRRIFPKKIIERIYEIGAQNSNKVVAINNVKALNEDFMQLYKYLYSYERVDKKSNGNNIKIFSAANSKEEVQFIAKKINNLVKNKGYRYSEIACVCTDLDNYYNLIDEVFSNYGIPYFSDHKEDLTEQCLSKIVINAYRTILNGYRTSDVISFAKECSYLINIEDILTFENYCIKHGVDFESGFKNSFQKDLNKQERVAESVRSIIYDYLSTIDVKKSNTVSDFVQMTYDLFEKINAIDMCDRIADIQKLDYPLLSKITNQTYRKITNMLDQINNMLGNCANMPFEQYVKVFESTIVSIKISNAPLVIDCVYVGEVVESRYEDKKTIFVMNAIDGKFPAETTPNNIIGEVETQLYSEFNVDIYPDVKRKNLDEKLNALMILIKPRNTLCITFPLKDNLGNENQKSKIIDDITNLVDTSIQKVSLPNNTWKENDYFEYLGCDRNSLGILIEMINLINKREIIRDTLVKNILSALYTVAIETFGKDVVDKLIKRDYSLETTLKKDKINHSQNFSASAFEKYFACPFKYYMDYVIKVSEREKNELRIADSGTILHAVLEKFFKSDWEQIPNDDNLKNVVKELIDESIKEDHFEYLFEEEFKNQYDALQREFVFTIGGLIDRMKNTNYKPYALEQKFGLGDDSWEAVKMQNKYGDIILRGIIDRIDTVGDDKAIIIDYKSKKHLDFKEANIIYGDRIQMVIYLKALLDNTNYSPKGLFYFLRNSTLSKDTDTKKFKYNGFISSQEDDFKDFKISNDDSYDSLYPIKKGSKKLTADGGSLIESSKGFQNMVEYVTNLLSKASEEIDEGYVKVTPLSNKSKEEIPDKCLYCSYKNICNISSHKDDIRKIQKDNVIADYLVFSEVE